MKTILRNITFAGVILSVFFIIPGIFAQDDEFIEIAPVEQSDDSSVLEAGTVKKHDAKKATPVPAEPTPAPDKKAPKKEKSRLESVTKILPVDLKDSVEIRIISTSKIKYKATDLNPPPTHRILLQLMKTEVKTRTIRVNKGSVLRVRSAPHNSTAWVVVDLSAESKWKVRQEGKTIIVEVPKDKSKPVAQRKKPEREKKPAKRMPGAMIYRVIDIAGKNLKNKTRIIVTADGPVKYRIKKNSGQKTLTLNILDAVSIWKKDRLTMSKGPVRSVVLKENRAGKTMDVVVSLRENSPYTVVRDQNQILIEIDDIREITRKYRKKLNLKEKISLNLQGAELPAVLRLIAAQTGFEFSASPSVANAGEVTMNLQDKTLGKVLNDILIPRNLFYEVRENVIHVGTTTELKAAKALRDKRTKFYSPRTMKPEDLQKMLNVQLQKEPLMDVSLYVDDAEGMNRIMMVGTEGDLDKLMDLIASIDTPTGGDYEEGYAGGLKTRVFKLQYMEPADITDTLQQVMSEEGKIQTDNRSGSIIVTDSVRYLKKVGNVIERLDVRIPQVMIEAKFYEININAAKELGVNWSAMSQDDQPYIEGDVSILPGTGAGELIVGMIQNGFRIDAYLSALERKNEASLLSSPKVTVETNKEATMYTTRTTYYEETEIEQGDSGPPVVTSTYKSIELPIQLVVTPKITDDGKIGMNVDVEVTKVMGQTSTAGPPDTSSQQARTYVTTTNNDTVVIGGMISERTTYTQDKVPLLGDLPLIGGFFQGTSQSKSRVELVVFLTPSIVQD